MVRQVNLDAVIDSHVAPQGVSDKVAYAFVKALRFVADTFFAKRYGHRAVVLETVAAVPGMVGGLLAAPHRPAHDARRPRLDPDADRRGG
jgi:ubiquinol oxidase